MKFGIFDHLDRNHLPLADYYEERLALIELIDRIGFHGYHLAEHHATPLGMAPSPSVFLAAVAQRTRNLRFGPLIYALPLYHPLRIVEEICMLDHISRGRLDIGFGRGASPIELQLYGQDPAAAREVFDEALQIVLQGLTQQTVDFRGKNFRYDQVPMEIAPLQRPHPPLWYGVHAADSARRCAQQGMNIVSLSGAAETRTYSDAFFPEWTRDGQRRDAEPLLGLGRMIVVAETDAEAVRLAERAYAVWHVSFCHLFDRYGRVPSNPRPKTFAELIADGRGIAGSPRSVTQSIQTQMETAGANYFVGQFLFGDLSREESARSIELFAQGAMPQLVQV